MTNKTTRDEKYAAAIAAWKIADTELAHSEADEVLIALLTELGYEKTVAAWEAIPKWYA